MTTATLDRPGTSADATAAPAPDRWYRPALTALLVGTAVLYLWGLGSSGWANSFYSAAAQAGSESWKAFFFGSSDAANSITVDKTPLSLWPMALSVRVFGLSSWSILVPQALEGVAAVALLTSTVRRTTRSGWSGLLAGLTLALTPVAVLMFRFDNPDALLVLLLIGSAAATVRSVEVGTQHPVRWLALAGALVGLAFLTKMLQAFLVLPAFALAYLLAANTTWGRRVGHLLVALGSMLVAAGWWVAIVSLWPAASRPYIGGSQHNSVLELTLGYNGFGRLTGDETGSVGGGGAPGGGSMWGQASLTRLFSAEVGGQVAWLLPAALLLLVAGLWLVRRAPRTDGVRAALVVWGGWLVVTGLTFSLMAGIFHAYYTVALAPAIGAVVGIGAHLARQRRAWLVLAGAVALTSATAGVLLGRSSDFLPWLRWVVLLAGLLAAAALAAGPRLPGRLGLVAAASAVVVAVAGPASYAVQTAATPHTGSIPSAGPTAAEGLGRPGRLPRNGFPGGPPTGMPPMGQPPQQGQRPAGAPTGAGPGGLLQASDPSAEVVSTLTEDAGDYTWVAAAVGSNQAAGYQLATEQPVMAIGGFNGSDPSPTLAEFKVLVAAGEIHWFVGGGGFGPSQGGSSTSSAIAAWVEETFSARTVEGVTLYDLAPGTAS